MADRIGTLLSPPIATPSMQLSQEASAMPGFPGAEAVPEEDAYEPRSRVIRQIVRGERAPRDLEETRDVLTELARRKCGDIAPEWMVEQVLAVTERTDWPTRRAAMEALLRRYAFRLRDELRVAKRPPNGAIVGSYKLVGSGAGNGKAKPSARPYATEIVSHSPLRGSCDCADFLRSSLGVCKHLLAVIEDVQSRPRRESQDPTAPHPVVLRWEPVRGFVGEGDRLSGLRLEITNGAPSTGRAAGRERLSRPATNAGIVAPPDRSMLRLFRTGAPDPDVLANSVRRQRFLQKLTEEIQHDRVHPESAARALVEDELTRIDRKLASCENAPRFLGHLKSLRRKLYDYQREGVRQFFEARRLLLADDMGLGKTTQAVAACHALMEAGEIRRGLLIVPASLKTQWVREWESITDVPIRAVDGRPEERQRTYRAVHRGFLVINYEQLLRDLEAVHQFRPDMVVLDEAQRIKNWATKSSVYVKTLSPEWRLVLTGTPMENRLEELASILDWVDDVALTPKWRLLPWHSYSHGNGAGGYSGARNLDTLRARLAPCTVRRVRKDVLAQLPPRTDTRIPVEMTEQQRREHDDLLIPIAQLVQRAHTRPLAQAEFLRLMQYLTTQRIVSNGLAQLRFDDVWPALSRRSRGEARLEAAFSPKLAEFRRLIQDLVLGQGRKVVVFSQWRKMLRLAEWAVQDVLAAGGRRAVFFTGAESQQKRTRSIVDFHDEEDVSVMFLTDAGGVGLNLQRAASACINLEMPWNPAVLEQRVGRIYRIGQDQPIDVYNLVSEYGIEARIAQLVATKKALFSGLFDGTTDEIRFDTNTGFLADVERMIEPIEVPNLPSDESGDETTDNPESIDNVDQAVAPESASPPDTSLALEAASNDEYPVASAENLDTAVPCDTDQTPIVPPAPDAPAPATVRAADGSTVAACPSGLPAHECSTALLDGGSSTACVNSPISHAPAEGTAPATSVGALLSTLQISNTLDGRLRLEAPPEAARELIRLFEGLAAVLRHGSDAASSTPVTAPSEPIAT